MSLPLPAFLLQAAKNIQMAGGEVFVVGGAVRDLLMGKTPLDYDLATNLRPEIVAGCFPFSVGTGMAHGTVTVWLDPAGRTEPIEITTYRGETTYTDGRRPDKIFYVQTIEEDLSRRDFTINAIAYEPFLQRLVDPFGGRADLEAKRVCAVGVPGERFEEDGLRPIRAIRFASCLDFSIEEKTFLALAQARKNIERVSLERIHDELQKILKRSKKPSTAIVLFRESQMMDLVLPGFLEPANWAVFLHQLDAAKSPIARWVMLWHLHSYAQTNQALRHLRFSNENRKKILNLLQAFPLDFPSSLSAGQVRRWIRKIGKNAIEDALDICAASGSLSVETMREQITEALSGNPCMDIADLKMRGEDLMHRFALPASPLVGELLQFLLEQVLEHPEWNQKDTLYALVENYLTRKSGEISKTT